MYRILLTLTICLVSLVCQGQQPPPPLMDWQTMERVTNQWLDAQPPRPYAKLIVWEDISPLLDEIQKKGWSMPYARPLEAVMVKQSDFLAKFAATESGARWLNASGGSKLLLDRVERVAKMENGQRTLEDVAKIPNGSKFAGPSAKNFMPGLADLLPLKGGRRPEIKDYNKPTGRLYTRAEVIRYMGQLHAASQKYFAK